MSPPTTAAEASISQSHCLLCASNLKVYVAAGSAGMLQQQALQVYVAAGSAGILSQGVLHLHHVV